MNITQSVIIPSDARGSTKTRDMQYADLEFPTSVRQLQNMCGKTQWRADLTGRIRKRKMVEAGDSFVFVDLPSEGFKALVSDFPDDDEEARQLFRSHQVHVFFPVVRSRPDKRPSLGALTSALRQIREVMLTEDITEATFLASSLKSLGEETVSSRVAEILKGIDVEIVFDEVI